VEQYFKWKAIKHGVVKSKEREGASVCFNTRQLFLLSEGNKAAQLTISSLAKVGRVFDIYMMFSQKRFE